MINILEKIINFIIQTQGILTFTLGFGVSCFVMYKLIKPDFVKMKNAYDSIKKIEAQSNGRMSFARTIARHDKKISLHEQAIMDIKDDIKEIKQDVKSTLRIFNSRIQDIPIIMDRKNDKND